MGTVNTSIAEALFSTVQKRVLSALFGQPEHLFYGNELIRLAASGVGAVRRELDKLESSGLVLVTRTGNQKFYQANKQAPIFNELRNIVIKTFGVADVLRLALLPVAEQIRLAFVFGSVAKGEDTANSDIDLMLVTDTLAYPDIYKILSEAEAQIGRKVNPTLYTVGELEKKVVAGNDFIKRVLYQPQILLIGNVDDVFTAG